MQLQSTASTFQRPHQNRPVRQYHLCAQLDCLRDNDFFDPDTMLTT